MKQADNELLCLVEGDTPMGKIMREHWMPACMSEEVSEAGGTPVRSRLLGEDIVVWRNSEGVVGALDEFCPHRGASLAFGRNEDCGLRCLYHGWKFDVNGNLLDMASEPDGTRMQGKTKTKAYPVRDAGGFIWLWMGDSDDVGEFQSPLWAPTEDTRISIVKMHAACNWAQVLEGSIDSAHSSSLHSSNMPSAADVSGSTATDDAWFRPSADKSPRLEFHRTDFGFEYAAIRKPLKNAETHNYIRTTLFIAPFTVAIPPNNQYKLCQLLIPIDDENCMFYWIAWHETKGIEQESWRKFCGAQVGVDVDENYKKYRNASNDYQQDRQAMKLGDYTGIAGIPTQDMAMWESMGKIADRSKDRLGTSDLAIVQFRRLMLERAKAINEGPLPKVEVSHVSLASFEGVVPKEYDWKSLNSGK